MGGNTSRTALLSLGWIGFVVALFLPCVDSTLGDEYYRAIGMQGYQCLLAVFVAPLGNLYATPLWLIIAAGNLSALFAPVYFSFRRPGRRLLAWVRAFSTLGVAGAFSLYALRETLRFTHFHSGYFVWCGALTVIALGVWLPAGAPEGADRDAG